MFCVLAGAEAAPSCFFLGKIAALRFIFNVALRLAF